MSANRRTWREKLRPWAIAAFIVFTAAFGVSSAGEVRWTDRDWRDRFHLGDGAVSVNAFPPLTLAHKVRRQLSARVGARDPSGWSANLRPRARGLRRAQFVLWPCQSPVLGVRIPLWMPFAAALVAAVLCSINPDRTIGRCENCSYDLTGNVSGRCPECGERTDAADLPAGPDGA